MTAIRDDMDNSAIIGVGFSLAFLIVFLILVLQAWFAKMNETELAKKSAPPASLTKYKAEQGDKLNGYGWVNQENNEVHIPIERAKQLALQTLSAKPAAVAPASSETSE